MASFVENTQHKVERKAFEIMANSIVGKLTKTDDIAKRQETFSGIPLPGGLHQALPGLLSGP